MSPDGPHQEQPTRTGGAPLARAKAGVVLLHGRGATAQSILTLADQLAQPNVAYLAPQAARRAWYPRSFLAPLAKNEPGLSSGLRAVGDAVARLEKEADLAPEQIVLIGFSQGACLSLEFVARRGQPLGGAVALSGGLLGTGEREDAQPPADKHFDYDGDLTGMPVFLGCSDRDPHIPLARVQQSAEVFRRLGADVDERIYEGLGHTINDDEVRFARSLLARVQEQAS